MNTSDYIVNRLIQGGIYYFELDSVSKKRPYLVISKDNGYGMNVLVFTITKQFISSKVSLPVVLNGEIGFIRISGTREVPMDKIDYGKVATAAFNAKKQGANFAPANACI